MRRHGLRGISIIELLIAIAVIGMFVAVASPAMLTLQRRAAARNAAAELRAIFHAARMRAITRGANCGIKFTSAADGWKYAMYDDGDGDGVRNDDINSGVDRCVLTPRRVLAASERRATIGLPPYKLVDPDGDPLPPTKSPVAFGNATICAFTPLGESTAGTIYLTDTIDDVYAVRTYAATARIRLLRWNRGTNKWDQK